MGMKHPDKVIVTITADHWNTSVFSGQEQLSSRTMLLISPGTAEAERHGEFSDDLGEFDALAESIDDLDMEVFDVAEALSQIRADYAAEPPINFKPQEPQ